MGREILSQAPVIVDSQSAKSTAAWEEESSMDTTVARR
jgi:hypothetical protein